MKADGKRTEYVYVHLSDSEARKKLIDDLEKEGYRCGVSREELISSKFPLNVSFTRKTVTQLNSVTAAACAASAGAIRNENEFREELQKYEKDSSEQ